MFTTRTTTRPKINPAAEVLYITEVSALFDIKPGTLRQYISRGTMPTPSVRRSPELGWDAPELYCWAYEQNLMPLAAVPFRHLRHVIDHTKTMGSPIPRVHGIESSTERGKRGVKVRYGGLTDEGLGFTLYYPLSSGQAAPAPGQVGITAEVTGHVHMRGFYVHVHQEHPDYEYAADAEVSTEDVARLVGAAIPYWPYALRATATGIDHATGHVTIVKNALPQVEWFVATRQQAIEAFATSPQGQERPELVEAMRADIHADYIAAAERTKTVIEKYVTPRLSDSWVLGEDADRHLVLAATPATVLPESAQDEAARESLPRLEWTEAVGDSPAARQVARERNQRSFAVASATRAQRAFLSALVPVDASAATLTHLSFHHPQQGTPSPATTNPCTFWRDVYSGALVTLYEATETSPAYCCYDVPEEYPEPLEPEIFDFTDERNPFMWETNGAAIPFPTNPDSGFSLGYVGSGPITTMETAARLVGGRWPAHKDAYQMSQTWPFYRPGYPTIIPAYELRERIDQAHA